MYQESRMKSPTLAVATAALVLLGGCATAPTGPSVLALPGTNRSFNDFRADESECRQYASQQISGSGSPNDQAVRSAIIGTAIGAVAGAAIGGNHQGTAIGAGTGLLFGSAVGNDSSQRSAYGSQRQYDNAYIQCMYGKGHRVPVSGTMSRNHYYAPTDPGGYYPPPPPSYAPSTTPPPDYMPPPPPR